MPAVNDILAGAANVAIRTINRRQEISPSSTTDVAPASTISDNHATPTDSGEGQGSSNTASSPLLFFVALGFGVVFTNLWIIVGVKYCFRYNARNRALRMAEEGEHVNMEHMPRPHRRRREKKLMSMDEVNDKFPMQKYKSWVAARAREGLPTAGGVSAPASRANSVRSVQAITPIVSKENNPTDSRQPDEEEATASSPTTARPARASLPPSRRSADDPDGRASEKDSDDDDDEPITGALPPELLGSSGDMCAICIDTLEDDEDVRGLPCGHAFHAQCLDPWLTTRRACCPLCKADYYTPKPRRTHTNTDAQLPALPADGPAQADTNTAQVRNRVEGRRSTTGINMPQPPQSTWQGMIARGRNILPGRREAGQQPGRTPAGQRRTNTGGSRRSGTNAARPTMTQQATTQAVQPPDTWQQRFRQLLPNSSSRQDPPPSSAATPGQFEYSAGVGVMHRSIA